MSTKKSKAWQTLIYSDILLGILLWFILFLLSAFGVIGMH